VVSLIARKFREIDFQSFFSLTQFSCFTRLLDAHALGTFLCLVSDGALRDDPRYGPDRGRSLDEEATGDDWRALLAVHMDADLRRGLGGPGAPPTDRHLGILLRMDAWDA